MPPKYNVPSLRPGYDCDYSNAEVLLIQMSVRERKISASRRYELPAACASEVWGDLDGTTRTVRNYGKVRVIWGKLPREILLNDAFEFTKNIGAAFEIWPWKEIKKSI